MESQRMKITRLDVMENVLALFGWLRQHPSVYWMVILIVAGIIVWRLR